MPTRTALRGLAAAVLALGCAWAQAQESALPPEQTQGAIRYVTGGIGSGESDAMKEAAARYPLALTFARQSGGHEVFLASVPVTIRDAAGTTLLELVTDGPYLLADLAPGSYRVSASLEGVEKSASFTVVAGKTQRVALVWPPKAGASELAAPAPAASAATTPDAVDEALPPRQNKDGIPYLTGGIGQQESQAIKAVAKKYSLSLTLASRREGRNAFLADVPVTVYSADGATVVAVSSDGPYMLIDLPPGSYRVVVTHAGVSKEAKVKIEAGKTVERAFLWTEAAAP